MDSNIQEKFDVTVYQVSLISTQSFSFACFFVIPNPFYNPTNATSANIYGLKLKTAFDYLI